jgi:hypothetical protein
MGPYDRPSLQKAGTKMDEENSSSGKVTQSPGHSHVPVVSTMGSSPLYTPNEDHQTIQFENKMTPENAGNESEQFAMLKRKLERRIKIEKYKNKKRNWLKKVSYNCRKRLADTRLRIKGRFISKKDSERLVTLYSKEEDMLVDDTKNLNIEMIPREEVIKVSDTKRRRLKAVKKLVESSKHQLWASKIAIKIKRRDRLFKIVRNQQLRY